MVIFVYSCCKAACYVRFIWKMQLNENNRHISTRTDSNINKQANKAQLRKQKETFMNILSPKRKFRYSRRAYKAYRDNKINLFAPKTENILVL